MAISVEDANSRRQESSFRKGYRDGVEAALAAITHKLSVHETSQIATWFADDLAPWVASGEMGLDLPPDFPILKK